MKINLIVIDELGTDYVAETIDSRAQEALGEHLDNFVTFRLNALKDRYPEARAIYREDEKTYGEMRCEEYEERLQANLEWAYAHADELDEDPEEWAIDATQDEMRDEWW